MGELPLTVNAMSKETTGLTFKSEQRSPSGKREDTELSQLESHSLQLFRNEKPKLLCEC